MARAIISSASGSCSEIFLARLATALTVMTSGSAPSSSASKISPLTRAPASSARRPRLERLGRQRATGALETLHAARPHPGGDELADHAAFGVEPALPEHEDVLHLDHGALGAGD